MTNHGAPGRQRRAPRPPRRAPRTSGTTDARPSQGGHGLWGRVTGAERRDQIQAQKYRPYSYESNRTTLRYAGVALGLWVALALWLAWVDWSNTNLYQDWESQGLTAIPPSGVEPTDLLAYAAAEGIACNSVEEIAALTPECVRVLDIRGDFGDSQDASTLLFAGMIFATVAAAFPFSTFVNRASRNLLTLRSAGQRDSPEWAVLWFFIPVMNAVRPIRVMREMFRASDPSVSTEDDREWRRTGKVPIILYVWWPLFVAAIFFNPVTVLQVWRGTRLDISDLIAASSLLIWADLLMVAVGIAAFLMLRELHLSQEARHEKVGDIVVTRPMPSDPFSRGGIEPSRSKEGDKS